MITHKELVEIVGRIKYPNFTIELAEADYFPEYVGRVVVHTMAPEVYDYLAGIPEPHMGPIAASFSVIYTDNESSVVRQAFQSIRTIILHEAGEFFQYGDERPFNPHRPNPVAEAVSKSLKQTVEALERYAEDLGESR